MANKFKCCKKDTSNYICVICHGIFHSSCMSRNKNIKILNDNFIYCSQKCNKEENTKKEDMERLVAELEENKQKLMQKDNTMTELEFRAMDELDEMKTLIAEQRNDNKAKDLFIAKLQKQIKDFEDEILEEDRKHEIRQSQQTRYFEEINKEMMEIKERNKSLLEEIEKHKGHQEQVTHELRELQEVQRMMVVSMETLEAEKEMYQNEVSKLRKRPVSKGINAQKNAVSPLKEDKIHGKSNLNVLKKEKLNIRLFTNSMGRRMSEVLFYQLGDTYSVHSIVKPNAKDDELLKDAISEAKKLTSNDILIFWPKLANKSLVQDLLIPYNVKTILITQPYHNINFKNINDLIYYNNLEMKREAIKVGKEKSILECNDVLRKNNFCQKGLSLNQTGKYFLCKAIKNLIENYKKITENKSVATGPSVETCPQNNINLNLNKSLWEEMQETLCENKTLDKNMFNSMGSSSLVNFQKTKRTDIQN